MPSNYEVIYADPPWSYDDKCLHRGGAARHYKTMSVEEICQLPIATLAADSCALFMWATFPKLFEAKQVIDAWGFNYKTCAFVWIKANRSTEIGQSMFFTEDPENFWGMGRWTRSNAEICLLATKGQPKRVNGGVHQIIYSPISKHSEKPDETRDRIVALMGNVARVELFARKKADGWSSWGNEVQNDLELNPNLLA